MVPSAIPIGDGGRNGELVGRKMIQEVDLPVEGRGRPPGPPGNERPPVHDDRPDVVARATAQSPLDLDVAP